MLQGVRTFCSSADQTEHQRLLACLKKIALFSNVFAPYFDIIDIFVQTKPDLSGWFWGTIFSAIKAGSQLVFFLEKIADMFEAIAYALPQYQHFHDSCKQQFQESGQDRLTTFMSLVYADLVQFCLEVHHMFSRNPQGVQSRHRVGFLASVLWRPLDSRFSHLQQRLVKHKEWFEAEMGVQNPEFVAQHRRELLDFVRGQGETNGEVEVERMSRRMKRVDKVRSWLAVCEYQDVYEQLVRQRHPGSCAWFLQRADYCNWKNAPFDEASANDTNALVSSCHERILFVQAKPGFGKTFISGQIIEDLGTKAEDANIDEEPSTTTTVFYYFGPSQQDSSAAFRALADQLVYAHRADRTTMDALALLTRQTSGQQKASSDDVIAVIALLLRQHPTFIVIDGIDECRDAERFLAPIPDLCRTSDCRFLLISRPDLQIPLEYQQWEPKAPHIIHLTNDDILPNIHSFLMETLNRMADQGYFGINMNRNLIPPIADRANGMFLWASLLTKYLQSPGLSPNERCATLEEAGHLEGLDALYREILSMLARRFGPDKRITTDIFRWLSLSIKPLNIHALHTALAIIPGARTAKKQHLLHFTDSVGRLTCALVEVIDGNTKFFHRSVKEYLQSPACRDLEFSLYDESMVHAQLASICISYLANDSPKRPLQRLRSYRPTAGSVATSSGMSFRTSSSGDSGYKSMSSSSDTEGRVHVENPQSPPFDIHMPFLRYAALCWPVHLTRALSNRPTGALSVEPFPHMAWLSALSQLLTDRVATTSWVEASWRYNLPPNLSRLVPLLNRVRSEIPPATNEGREIRSVVDALRQLSDALGELRNNYGVTLRENPSLIWQWNIQATSEGAFWPTWDEGRGCVHAPEA
ncbi:hypothetical protein EJ04DRAFT_510470 [Polyplosphaeria fusca]|uniref:Nephrocystin 3-like N-terminal domain-containing protein n=1 Tax=Polyplosphaeria fusca TaxID=682080 RepID=A0A9P4R5V5_9PLEO|nr:hypothetical protein EJ04DRAFT_510470 [Polyplosphaeria fusca]